MERLVCFMSSSLEGHHSRVCGIRVINLQCMCYQSPTYGHVFINVQCIYVYMYVNCCRVTFNSNGVHSNKSIGLNK